MYDEENPIKLIYCSNKFIGTDLSISFKLNTRDAWMQEKIVADWTIFGRIRHLKNEPIDFSNDPLSNHPNFDGPKNIQDSPEKYEKTNTRIQIDHLAWYGGLFHHRACPRIF